MKWTKRQSKNLAFLAIAALFIIPYTRKPIQIMVNKGVALFGPSIKSPSEQKNIGDVDWVLIGDNGEPLNFSDAKGEVIFINFWATWCPPCIAEMPSMHDLYKDYKDKIEFIFVSDEKPEVVDRFLREKGYDFEVYRSAEKYPEIFDVSGIPRTFLINAKGNIVIDKTGAANWNSDKVHRVIGDLLQEQAIN